VLVKMRAKKNSSYACRKMNIAVETNPGAEIGIMILYKISIREHPSIRAASSSSTGIVSKKADMIQIAKGKAKLK